jgi:E3 ubiquitin-protein ligase RGLG
MGQSSSKPAETEERISTIVQSALGRDTPFPEWANRNEIFSIKDLNAALKDAGVESTSLIVGIDFTASNKSQGEHSFGGKCLHEISSLEKNPYELVLDLVWNSIADLDDDGLITMFSFGDVRTRHKSVELIGNGPCQGMEQAQKAYRQAAGALKLSGPTSFAPLIRQAIKMVRKTGGQYHILLIIGDGGVSDDLDCFAETRRALVEASNEPLSIIMVGVGDGPWDKMGELDDGLPERSFDNFQFVPLAPFQALLAAPGRGGAGGAGARGRTMVECAFAVAALQEVPQQYAAIRSLGLFERGPASDVDNGGSSGEAAVAACGKRGGDDGEEEGWRPDKAPRR